MAVLLANSGIETTVIQDSAIYALMSRVNKVILGVHAGIDRFNLVTTSGGVLAPAGSQIVASAAMHHSTPVVVCVCTHSLTSEHLNTDMNKYSHCISPENVFGFQNGSLAKHVYLPNPRFDYIPSETITLFITNIGPHPPSEIQRIIAELKV
jgi:translation initiation factor eIF-2B subunit beta